MVENGLQMFIWIGQSVSPTDISSIWGVNTPMEVLDGPIPVKDTENNSTLRMVLTRKKTLIFDTLFIFDHYSRVQLCF